MNIKTKIIIIISFLLVIVYWLLSSLNVEKEIICKNVYLFTYFFIIIIYLLIESKKIVSIKSLYVLMYSLMFGLSPWFYILNNKSYYIQGKNIIYQFPLAIIGLIILVISFYVPLLNMKKNKNMEQNNYNYLGYNYIISIFLIIFSTIINFIYIYQNKSFFFASTLETSRIEALAGNGILITLSSLNLVGTSLLFDYYLKTNKKKLVLIISVILFVLIYIIRGSRTPILRLFIIMILIYNCEKKIKFKRIILLFFISLLILSGLLVIRAKFSGVNMTVFSALFSNLQTGAINFNYIYKVFPNIVPFQKGNSFLINLKMMLPGKDLDFTLWLKDTIGISFAGGGVTPSLFGEGYLNFGYLGGFFEIFVIGLLGRKFDQSYLNNNSSTFWTIYLSIILLDVFRGGFANVEVALLLTLLIYIVYVLLYKKDLKT